MSDDQNTQNNTSGAQMGGDPMAGGNPPAGGMPASPMPPIPPGGVAGGGLSGIMEEDVDVGDLVANSAQNQEESKRLMSMPIAPHPNTTFDEQKFLSLLAGSISLTPKEKERIVESIPKLSQYQIDELMKIFEEEKGKFAELEKKHADQIAELEKQHSTSWEAIEQKKEEEAKRRQEEEQAALLMQQLGGGTEAQSQFELLFYVNGELCGKKLVAQNISREEAIFLAKQDPSVMPQIQGKQIKEEVYEPGQYVNIVTE